MILAEITWENGIKEGNSKYYYSTGQLESEGNYKMEK